MRPLHLIVAHDLDRAIGAGGGMPWHHPQDLEHFRRLTMGHCLVMGRCTLMAIGRPLPGRQAVVLTRDLRHLPDWARAWATPAGDLDTAMLLAWEQDPEPFVAGGASVYRQTLPLASHLHITRIAAHHPGADRFFPELPGTAWYEADHHQDGMLRWSTWLRRSG